VLEIPQLERKLDSTGLAWPCMVMHSVQHNRKVKSTFSGLESLLSSHLREPRLRPRCDFLLIPNVSHTVLLHQLLSPSIESGSLLFKQGGDLGAEQVVLGFAQCYKSEDEWACQRLLRLLSHN